MMASDSPRIFVPPPLIFGGLAGLGVLIQRQPPAPASLLGLASVIMMVTGTVCILTAFGLFRAAGTRAEPWRSSSELVAAGIYRVSRNPMYLGMAFIVFGVALLFRSWPAAGLAMLATLIVDRLVISREEAYLVRRFGDRYRAYLEQTRRWL